MQKIHKIFRRILALSLTVLTLWSGSGVLAAESIPPELFTVQDAGIKALTATAGSWNKGFQSSVKSGYVLALSVEEPSFRLHVTPNENDPQYAPAVTVDGTPVSYGEASQEITLDLGERRSIEIVVTPRDGVSASYSVTAYRTDTQVKLTAVPGERAYADGSRQVVVELRLTQGAEIDSLGLELHFDPKQLRLANRATNEPSTSFAGFYTCDSKFSGIMQTVTMKTDNDKGQLLLDFGLKMSATGKVYTAGADPVMTFCFRLEPEGALTDEALSLKRNGNFRYGAQFTQMGTAVAYETMAQWEGVERALRLPELTANGGCVRVTPDKSTYQYGERVTLTAIPGTGYQFTQWDGSDDVIAAIGGAEALYQREVSVRLWEEIDLGALTPNFEKLDECMEDGTALDFTAPHIGSGGIMAYNPAYSGASRWVGGMFSAPEGGAENGTLAESPSPYSTREDAEDNPLGLTEVEFFEPEPTDAALLGLKGESVELVDTESAPNLGDVKSFAMRDTRVASSTAAGAWTNGSFQLMKVRMVGTQSLYIWLCQKEDWQPVTLTDAQLEELANSFEQSYTYLTEHIRPVADQNGNGGLDVLLYDIRDSYTSGGTSYTGGFINSWEFFGKLGPNSTYQQGNSGDVLHLDTWPQMQSKTNPTLAKTESTMAHETQHLTQCSRFSGFAEWQNGTLPTWINEGLSMTVEHDLFGTLTSRINKYNTSNAIKYGDSLTVWGNQTDDYAQAYLFFQYLRAQTGATSFITRLYDCDPSVSEEENLNTMLKAHPVFEGKTISDVIRDFYLALMLKRDSGPYGFGGETAFDAVKPQILSQGEFSRLLQSSGAVYGETPGSFTPAESNGAEYVSWANPVYLLTIGTGEGGSAAVAKTLYERNEPAVITATPAAGWRFVCWEGDGDQSSENPLTVVMDGDKTLTPVFEPIPTYTLTLSCNGSSVGSLGSITVTDAEGMDWANLSTIPEGTVLTLRAQPRSIAKFVGWSGDVEGAQPRVTVTMDRDRQVAAEFEQLSVARADEMLLQEEGQAPARVDTEQNRIIMETSGGTVTLEPTDGTVKLDASGQLVQGTPIILRATPVDGKVFRYWRTFTRPSSSAAENAAMEESCGVVDGQVLTDTQLRSPILHTTVSETTLYSAVYGDPADVSAEKLLLAYLRLVTPEGRNLIQRESRNLGFSSSVNDYELYLVSSDSPNLVLNAVLKGEFKDGAGVQGKIYLRRNGMQVGDPITVEDYAGDENPDGSVPALKDLAVPGVQDGDVLVVTVGDGTEAGVGNTYRISIHRTTAENDPKAEAVFEKSETDGYTHLSLYLQNVATEAATISITMSRDVLTLLRADGSEYDGSGVSGLPIFTAEDRYTLEKAVFVPADETHVTLQLTIGVNSLNLPEHQPRPEKAVELLCRKAAETPADWFIKKAPILLYDANLLELEFEATVTEILGRHQVTGTFRAYNPAVTYSGQPDDGYRVYLKKTDGVLEIVADSAEAEETDGPEYGLRSFRFTTKGVPQGEYDLIIRKPGHTQLTVKGMTVAADVDVDKLLKEPLTLTVGDVDGDGWVRTFDKVALTNTSRYGLAVNHAVGEPNAIYDLDGDGYIRAFDLYLLLDSYGKGETVITLEPGEAET